MIQINVDKDMKVQRMLRSESVCSNLASSQATPEMLRAGRDSSPSFRSIISSLVIFPRTAGTGNISSMRRKKDSTAAVTLPYHSIMLLQSKCMCWNISSII